MKQKVNKFKTIAEAEIWDTSVDIYFRNNKPTPILFFSAIVNYK